MKSATELPTDPIRVCVTGSSGFLGKALVNELRRSGYQVLALSRTSDKNGSNVDFLKTQTIAGSFGDWENAIMNFLPEIIISCDWSGVSKEERDSPLQILNTERVAKLAKLAAKLKVRTFLTFGSQAETAPSANKIPEQCIQVAQNQYGLSKIELKQLLIKIFTNTETELIWGRIFSVYGPGDTRESIVTRSIKDALEGNFTLITNPNLDWSFLYIDDFTEAVLTLLQNISVPSEVNIGHEKPVKLQSINDTLGEIFDHKPVTEMVHQNISEFENLSWIPETGTLINFGWEPKTTLSEGIQETVKWWRQEKGISW